MCRFLKGKLTSDTTMVLYRSMEKREQKFSKYTMWGGEVNTFLYRRKKNQEYK